MFLELLRTGDMFDKTIIMGDIEAPCTQLEVADKRKQ